MSAAYIARRLGWVEWIRYLAVALDLQEQDDFHFWILAGQDAKKFQWASPDKAGTADSGAVGDKIIQYAVQEMGATPQKGDIWALAEAKGMQPVYKAKKFDADTGKFIGFVYVDGDGNEVDTAGQNIIESKHKDARRAAEEFFGLDEG